MCCPMFGERKCGGCSAFLSGNCPFPDVMNERLRIQLDAQRTPASEEVTMSCPNIQRARSLSDELVAALRRLGATSATATAADLVHLFSVTARVRSLKDRSQIDATALEVASSWADKKMCNEAANAIRVSFPRWRQQALEVATGRRDPVPVVMDAMVICVIASLVPWRFDIQEVAEWVAASISAHPGAFMAGLPVIQDRIDFENPRAIGRPVRRMIAAMLDTPRLAKLDLEADTGKCAVCGEKVDRHWRLDNRCPRCRTATYYRASHYHPTRKES